MGAGGGYAEHQNPLRGHDFRGHRRMRAHGWPPATESYPGQSYVTRVDGRVSDQVRCTVIKMRAAPRAPTPRSRRSTDRFRPGERAGRAARPAAAPALKLPRALATHPTLLLLKEMPCPHRPKIAQLIHIICAINAEGTSVTSIDHVVCPHPRGDPADLPHRRKFVRPAPRPSAGRPAVREVSHGTEVTAAPRRVSGGRPPGTPKNKTRPPPPHHPTLPNQITPPPTPFPSLLKIHNIILHHAHLQSLD